MKRIISTLIAVAGLSAATSAQAACYAEYKAKRDNPLELFYDVAAISGPCTKANAAAVLRPRLAAQGMTLLKVLSVRDG